MKLESDHWKLEAVDVQDAEELFWPTSPTRYYTIARSTQSPSSQVLCSEKLKSPVSLKQLAMETYFAQLKNLCQHHNYEQKRSLKHYLKFQLPTALRQELLDLSMKEHRIYTLVDLNMFELLLSTSVKHVSVHEVRSFFRQQFVTAMRQLGTGLEQLAIHDSSWLHSRENLPAALGRMTHLRKISLHFLANDTMIAALARNCRHMQEMDVSYSIDVTDAGMRILSDPDGDLLISTKPKLQPQLALDVGWNEQRRRKISAPARTSGHVSGCMLWFPRLVRGIRRHSVVEQQKQGRRDPLAYSLYQDDLAKEGGDTTCPLWHEEESATGKSREIKPQSCIRSLRRLQLIGTSVTSYGVQFVLSASPSVTVVS